MATKFLWFLRFFSVLQFFLAPQTRVPHCSGQASMNLDLPAPQGGLGMLPLSRIRTVEDAHGQQNNPNRSLPNTPTSDLPAAQPLLGKLLTDQQDPALRAAAAGLADDDNLPPEGAPLLFRNDTELDPHAQDHAMQVDDDEDVGLASLLSWLTTSPPADGQDSKGNALGFDPDDLPPVGALLLSRLDTEQPVDSSGDASSEQLPSGLPLFDRQQTEQAVEGGTGGDSDELSDGAPPLFGRQQTEQPVEGGAAGDSDELPQGAPLISRQDTEQAVEKNQNTHTPSYNNLGRGSSFKLSMSLSRPAAAATSTSATTADPDELPQTGTLLVKQITEQKP
eukprot:g46602.t1